MKFEKVLVTGGAGFIGSHLCERLLKEGYYVICLDNFDPYYDPDLKRRNIKVCLNDNNFKLIEMDVRDRDGEKRLFKNNDIDKVVHLAAKVGVRASISQPILYEDVNVKGTLNLLEIAKDYNVDSFISGSSSSVYGITDKIPFTEEDAIQKAISPYAASKRSCELFCYIYSHLYDMSITCLRFFTVYGPRQRPDMAINRFTRLIDQGKEVPVFGDGFSKRDYTYISDVVDGIVSALNSKFNFEIFNLGSSNPVELNYIISLIEKELGKKAKIRWLPTQPGDVPITYADISKARKMLHFNPKVPIEEGIKEFVNWCLNSGNRRLIKC